VLRGFFDNYMENPVARGTVGGSGAAVGATVAGMDFGYAAAAGVLFFLIIASWMTLAKRLFPDRNQRRPRA